MKSAAAAAASTPLESAEPPEPMKNTDSFQPSPLPTSIPSWHTNPPTSHPITSGGGGGNTKNNTSASGGGGNVVGGKLVLFVPANYGHHEDPFHFRRVKRISDVYAFDESRDCVGKGTFSTVYRAIPVAAVEGNVSRSSRPSPLPPQPPHTLSSLNGTKNEVIIKVIPRHKLNRVRVPLISQVANIGESTSPPPPPPPPPSTAAAALDSDAAADWSSSDSASTATLQMERRVANIWGLERPKGEDTQQQQQREKEGSQQPVADKRVPFPPPPSVVYAHPKALRERCDVVEVEREINVLRRLRHSGCSLFREAVKTDDAYVIVMAQQRASMDARRYLERFGVPCEMQAAMIVFQLLTTLRYLHDEYGLLHRDVKLENIVLSPLNDEDDDNDVVDDDDYEEEEEEECFTRKSRPTTTTTSSSSTYSSDCSSFNDSSSSSTSSSEWNGSEREQVREVAEMNGRSCIELLEKKKKETNSSSDHESDGDGVPLRSSTTQEYGNGSTETTHHHQNHHYRLHGRRSLQTRVSFGSLASISVESDHAVSLRVSDSGAMKNEGHERDSAKRHDDTRLQASNENENSNDDEHDDEQEEGEGEGEERVETQRHRDSGEESRGDHRHDGDTHVIAPNNKLHAGNTSGSGGMIGVSSRGGGGGGDAGVSEAAAVFLPGLGESDPEKGKLASGVENAICENENHRTPASSNSNNNNTITAPPLSATAAVAAAAEGISQHSASTESVPSSSSINNNNNNTHIASAGDPENKSSSHSDEARRSSSGTVNSEKDRDDRKKNTPPPPPPPSQRSHHHHHHEKRGIDERRVKRKPHRSRAENLVKDLASSSSVTRSATARSYVKATLIDFGLSRQTLGVQTQTPLAPPPHPSCEAETLVVLSSPTEFPPPPLSVPLSKVAPSATTVAATGVKDSLPPSPQRWGGTTKVASYPAQGSSASPLAGGGCSTSSSSLTAPPHIHVPLMRRSVSSGRLFDTEDLQQHQHQQQQLHLHGQAHTRLASFSSTSSAAMEKEISHAALVMNAVPGVPSHDDLLLAGWYTGSSKEELRAVAPTQLYPQRSSTVFSETTNNNNTNSNNSEGLGTLNSPKTGPVLSDVATVLSGNAPNEGESSNNNDDDYHEEEEEEEEGEERMGSERDSDEGVLSTLYGSSDEDDVDDQDNDDDGNGHACEEGLPPPSSFPPSSHQVTGTVESPQRHRHRKGKRASPGKQTHHQHHNHHNHHHGQKDDSDHKKKREEPTLTAAPVLFHYTQLLLSPCGTDRYLPPEMLGWMVNNPGKKRPTSIAHARQLDSYAVGVVAYVLLSGYFPFNGRSKATLCQQQQRVPKCNSEAWKNVSEEAIKFVQQLLEPDPTVRCTIKDALDHPWMKSVKKIAIKYGLEPHPLMQQQQQKTPNTQRSQQRRRSHHHHHHHDHSKTLKTIHDAHLSQHQQKQQQDASSSCKSSNPGKIAASQEEKLKKNTTTRSESSTSSSSSSSESGSSLSKRHGLKGTLSCSTTLPNVFLGVPAVSPLQQQEKQHQPSTTAAFQLPQQRRSKSADHDDDDEMEKEKNASDTNSSASSDSSSDSEDAFDRLYRRMTKEDDDEDKKSNPNHSHHPRNAQRVSSTLGAAIGDSKSEWQQKQQQQKKKKQQQHPPLCYYGSSSSSSGGSDESGGSKQHHERGYSKSQSSTL